MSTLSRLLDLFAPPRCIGCETTVAPDEGPLCRRCLQHLPWWRKVDGCPRCGVALHSRTDHWHGRPDNIACEGCPTCLLDGTALHACYTLTRYEGPLRHWIPGFKNARSPFGPAVQIRLAIDHLAVLLAHRVARQTRQRPNLIVSIPLHPRRRRHRGFNHVDPIAQRVAEILSIPHATDALERLKDTPPQAGLTGPARRKNIRGAFRIASDLGPATRVWLIDDVLTTGSTLEAADDALLEKGCREVRALTIAATLPARRKRPASQRVMAGSLSRFS
ncbi:MAG: ComF family protein [Myxococcota bacterium]